MPPLGRRAETACSRLHSAPPHQKTDSSPGRDEGAVVQTVYHAAAQHDFCLNGSHTDRSITTVYILYYSRLPVYSVYQDQVTL